jgi:hypothetical protein
MWIVAVLSDGPLRGQHVEIDVLNSKPPKQLELVDANGALYTYIIGRASTRARRWTYCYLAGRSVAGVAGVADRRAG